MHLRQTSDASAASAVRCSQRSLHFIFFKLFFASSLLKFLPAVRRSHTLYPPSSPYSFSPCASLLLLPLCLATCLLPIFIIAAIIWQMLLSPALVSVALPPLSSLPASLYPLSTQFTFPFFLLPQLASAVPASGYCLLLGAVCVVLLPFPFSLSPFSAFSSLRLPLSFSAVAIYLIACLLRCGCCASRQGISLKLQFMSIVKTRSDSLLIKIPKIYRRKRRKINNNNNMKPHKLLTSVAREAKRTVERDLSFSLPVGLTADLHTYVMYISFCISVS